MPMTTVEDATSTVATALRGVVGKAADLIESTHIHSLGDAGHEVVSRVQAGTPDLPARVGSVPVDLHSLRASTARRAHQLAHSIDDRADTLAPTKPGGRRWPKRFLVLALAGAAAFYLSRKLKEGKTPPLRVYEPPVEIPREEAVADAVAAPGDPADTVPTTLGPKNSSNGTRSKKTPAK